MKHAVRLMFVVLVVGWLAAMASFSTCSNLNARSVSTYIGNSRSYVFHRQTCRHLPAAKNRTYFNTRSEAVDAGYRPCRKCKP